MFLEIFKQSQFSAYASEHCLGPAPFPSELAAQLSPDAMVQAHAEISSWPGYQPTPLRRLEELAEQAGVGNIMYKDEAERFGLGSFKALGGAYAVFRVLQSAIEEQTGTAPSSQALASKKFQKQAGRITVVTATDGNHGRSVAWGAQRFGCRCRIYIHAEVSDFRAQAIQALGAEVIRIDGDYDDSVRLAEQEAADNEWIVVSDTTYPGYVEIPRFVMAGYSVMMNEVFTQLENQNITHVFVQGGVGGLAASVAAYCWHRMAVKRPKLIIVEPEWAACLYQSAVNGKVTAVVIENETLMAGLSCGEPSILAWNILKPSCQAYMTMADELVVPGMRLLANQSPPIIAGESAVAGLAGLLLSMQNAGWATQLELNRDSVVLLLGSEGATDPKIYQQLINTSHLAKKTSASI